MSALQKIRSKSTLLVAIIAIGLLAFVVPWGEITQFLNVSKDKAFVVNGDVVKTGQYSSRLGQAETFAKVRTADGQLNEQQTSELREQVFNSMVTEMLIEDQADKLGLAVTTEELNDMVYGANVSPVLYQVPYFADPQTGMFSHAALTEFLTIVNQPTSTNPEMRAQQDEIRSIWAFVENEMRSNRLEEKYASLVSNTVLVNNIEAKAYYNDSRQEANIAYVSQKYDAMSDDGFEVSNTEIQDLYNKKKESFFSKYPSRTITYFVKNVLPSEADNQEAENQILEVKKELIESENVGMIVNQYSRIPYNDIYTAIRSLPLEERNFVQSSSVGDIHGPTHGDRAYTMYKYVSKTVAPDSIKIQLIPIQTFDPIQATAIADSLQGVLKQGKTFEALAREMYPNVPEMGRSEWVNERVLAQAGADAVKACFNAAKGEVIKLEIGGGTSLIRIDDRTKSIDKVKVATIQIPVIVSDRTNNSIDNEINKFLSENKDPSKFKDVALNSGYNVISDVTIFPNLSVLTNVPGTRDVIRWAFNESTGEVKKFETNNARIVAIVTGEAKEGYASLANKEIEEMLRKEVLRDKKAEKIIAELKGKDISSLSALAESLASGVDTAKFVSFQTSNIGGVGYEPVLNVASKVAPVNTVSEPLQGLNGVYLINVANKKEANTEYDEKATKQMLSSSYSQMLSYFASAMLMEKMNVEDNRVKFY